MLRSSAAIYRVVFFGLAVQLVSVVLWGTGKQPQLLEKALGRKKAESAWPLTHDYRVKRGWTSRHGGPIRLLAVTEYDNFLHSMNTWRYELFDAMKAHPDVFLDVSGPGWAGWDDSVSLNANVDSRVLPRELRRPSFPTGPVGCGFYDVVMVYASTIPLEKLHCGTLLLQQLPDCNAADCLGRAAVRHADIVAGRFASELLDQIDHRKLEAEHGPQGKNWEMPLFAQIPDAANEWDFFPGPWEERVNDAVLLGTTTQLYPIRHTVHQAARQNKTSITVFPHAGREVGLANALGDPLTTYRPYTRQQREPLEARRRFAEVMRTSKVCVFDGSVQRKMLRKYHQAFLSGCVVAADMPTEHQEALRDFIIELKQSWSIDQIEAAVNAALANPEELQRKALLAYYYARERLTYSRQVDRILNVVDQYKKGERGYQLYETFSLLCRSYGLVEPGKPLPWRPAWCEGDQWFVRSTG